MEVENGAPADPRRRELPPQSLRNCPFSTLLPDVRLPAPLSPSFLEGSNMLVADAQRHVRTVFIGGFWGQLVSSIIWLASAALATWWTPRAAISTLVFGGFFIFPAIVLLLRLTGGPRSPTK